MHKARFFDTPSGGAGGGLLGEAGPGNSVEFLSLHIDVEFRHPSDVLKLLIK